MNKVMLIGRLTADPELRQTQNGIASCQFTVAVNRKFADKNTGERQADFIRCQAWRNTAEFISRYFTKGKMIAVEGSLRTGSYQDKNHPDVMHYTTDLMVDNVEFCGDKTGTNPGQAAAEPVNIVEQAKAAGVETAMDYGNLSDFEEILSDGDCPF